MKAYGWFGLALLLLSEYCLFRKIEPFYSWFYCFAWWSYILLADNLLVRLRGRSLLNGARGEFLRMLPLSVFIWLLFEAYNFRIRNWAYDGVPDQWWVRWPGYALAFATVLPGIFITSDLVEVLFTRSADSPASGSEASSGKASQDSSGWFLLIGGVLCAAPLIWPRYFFPAVWLGPIFLLDPIVERAGIRSLSSSVSGRDFRRVGSLLLGGLLCGFIWEFWNFWAASKWLYTVPFFDRWKVFEMPLAGFLGFPPFALECWILYHLLRTMLQRTASLRLRVALWTVIGLLCLLIFYGIDRHTVVRFAEQPFWSVGPCKLA